MRHANQGLNLVNFSCIFFLKLFKNYSSFDSYLHITFEFDAFIIEFPRYLGVYYRDIVYITVFLFLLKSRKLCPGSLILYFSRFLSNAKETCFLIQWRFHIELIYLKNNQEPFSEQKNVSTMRYSSTINFF